MSDVEGDDEFQDAQESLQITSMDLDTAIMEAKKAINLFFNNEFEKAKEILQPWADSSMYHSLGATVLAFLEAIFSFDVKCLGNARETVKQCMHVCSKHRKQSSITQNFGKMVKGVNYDDYTIEEVHAELCYAESLLIKSMLTLVEDESLISFVRAGLKIRSCFLSYKECMTILNNRNWDNDIHKVHFESGVRMGIGTFNLLISMLPTRVVKLVEYVGFSGDKEYGLSELMTGYGQRTGLRHILCVITLLSYHLIFMFMLCYMDGDLDWCEQVLNEKLTLYPKGVWFLFFKARLELNRGHIEDSINWYTKSWKSQTMWPQFHHLCFWELMWTNCMLQEWNEALSFAMKLLQESNWSPTIYSYQKAAILIMQKSSNYSDEQLIDKLMVQVPVYKQRIAGKSVPIEKFVIKKAERYFAQKKFLLVPMFEMMYVWNFFRILGKRPDLMLDIYKTLEEEEKAFEMAPKNEFDADNRALLLLLKGACLRQMQHPLQSEECLRRVLRLEKSIKEDTYLIPYAIVELALLALDQHAYKEAASYLQDVKKNYTGYLLESRLHLKVHANLMMTENMSNDTPEDERVEFTANNLAAGPST
ncbi:tetratricopeptide repeat protein 39B [Harpegnathos saltator]|nr:tetratricopeptide repeat protein 39B [Harpegnathos saltator]XP_011148352.1 tetratricopeptide repeat protein 39B [Harpegnathos saltator]XP_019699397.1 tetratricopeptide repeat protein 39B [Harpegnathos saltator]XP_019699398.1 tetratricopeptide repeat protein 39B [Harpegnathos saltator]XP_025159288.1 tetratricopeptide repeat protein 39B [Harpegnathos saltator]